jgi:drug/metabolite transporter (DMT)-like permease
MSVRVTSKVLAAIFVLLGVGCTVLTSKFVDIFAELKLDPPFISRATPGFGIAWWLVICCTFAGLTLWKDSWKKPRVPNSFFVIVLAVIVLTLMRSLFLPLIIDVGAVPKIESEEHPK